MKNKNTKIQILLTAGKGPLECQYVVAKVLGIFLEEIRKVCLDAQVIAKNEGWENGALQSAVVVIDTLQNIEVLESWLGTVLWISKSNVRAFHQRKNWYITIAKISGETFMQINEKEITYQAIRSGGAGGQHVNKVSSAVRATYAPLGISVVAQDSRSQHQNKKLAKERLIEKINEKNIELFQKQLAETWDKHLNVQRGNPVRVFQQPLHKTKQPKPTYKTERQKLKSDLRKEF